MTIYRLVCGLSNYIDSKFIGVSYLVVDDIGNDDAVVPLHFVRVDNSLLGLKLDPLYDPE